MGRKTQEEINELCKKYGVDKLWSWSRYHCYKQDKYEYYLKYVEHVPSDREPSIYAVSGGNIHDIIEKLYNNEIEYDDMCTAYEDSLFIMNCSDLKYNRSDSEKNEAIANKYENCIRHFFKHHNQITSQNRTEYFITIKIADDIYMQGYVDMIYFVPDEECQKKTRVHIVDWKSSTRYQGQKIEKECGQLLLYAEGISQLLNIPLEDIVCEWNFLKYVTVTIEQKNGKKKDRHIERNAIGESLVNTAKMWLKAFGYEDEMDDCIDQMIGENSIDNLPEEVREKFEIKDCYIQVPLSEERIAALKEDIIETVHEINEKEDEYSKTKDEQIWWQEATESDEFRLATLCDYSRKLHKPYDEYLKEKELFIEEKDEETVEDELLDFLKQL